MHDYEKDRNHPTKDIFNHEAEKYNGSLHVNWCKPGHDPSQNLIKIAKLLQYIRYDNPENLYLISCMD